jgi:hypothetical protein
MDTKEAFLDRFYPSFPFGFVRKTERPAAVQAPGVPMCQAWQDVQSLAQRLFLFVSPGKAFFQRIETFALSCLSRWGSLFF